MSDECISVAVIPASAGIQKPPEQVPGFPQPCLAKAAGGNDGKNIRIIIHPGNR